MLIINSRRHWQCYILPMFEFKSEIPPPARISLTTIDALSGLFFLITAWYAYSIGLTAVALIALAICTTTVIHLFYPYYVIRLLDYALAVTFVFICLILVYTSNFSYPYSVTAAGMCSIAFLCYGLHQSHRSTWNIYYFLWHVFAFLTTMASLTAYASSL